MGIGYWLDFVVCNFSISAPEPSFLLQPTEELGGRRRRGDEEEEAAPDSPPLIPLAAHPVLDCMAALEKVVKGSFGYELDPDYKQLIANYVDQLRELPALMLATCGVSKGFTWKVGVCWYIVC